MQSSFSPKHRKSPASFWWKLQSALVTGFFLTIFYWVAPIGRAVPIHFERGLLHIPKHKECFSCGPSHSAYDSPMHTGIKVSIRFHRGLRSHPFMGVPKKHKTRFQSAFNADSLHLNYVKWNIPVTWISIRFRRGLQSRPESQTIEERLQIFKSAFSGGPYSHLHAPNFGYSNWWHVSIRYKSRPFQFAI